METVGIPESSVPVLAHCDVLVCGAGSAGVAAAVSAGRHGADVIVLERWAVVGGMATAALVTGFHRSDREKKVIFGLAQETVDRLDREGWVFMHVQNPHVHETEWFEPEGVKIVWQRMLDEAGVRTISHVVAGEPILEDGRIRGVLIDTKRGRRAVLADVVIDATGDGDVAAKSGCPFEFGRASDGRVQGMTMMYRLCGIDDARRSAIPPDEQRAINHEMEEASRTGELPPYNFACTPCGISNYWWPNMCPVAGDPLDEQTLTRLTAKAREQVHEYVRWYRKHVPGFENVFLMHTAFSLGIRESRRIRGLKTLTPEMILGAEKQPDAVGHGVWMIDIHDPMGTGYTTWNDRGTRNMVPRGESYHIPLGVCLNETIPNLAVAGRCASSTHEGHSSVRVMSHCMVMAQGVGTAAAAMTLEAATQLRDVDLPRLQETLRQDGVYLEDVPPA